MKRERAPIGWPGRTVLDQIDRAIILALQTDGRMSQARLAKAVVLSQPAVRRRVNEKIEAGVMEIVALTNPLRLGFHVHADLGLNVSGDPRTVVEALPSLPAIVYLRYTAGRVEIMAEVLFETSGELHAFVNGRLSEIPGATGSRP
jgi:Lrp/AsnC family transcriptional regulator for asnA, asnC and gidA